MSMSADMHTSGIPLSPLVLVRPEPPGRFTAQAVGLPEIHATAATREEAVEQVRKILQEWLVAGNLVPVQLSQENPSQKWPGSVDPNDPDERAYLEELARFRQEDLERTLKEYEQECSNSSSTPTT
jgi:hypothetical protein